MRRVVFMLGVLVMAESGAQENCREKVDNVLSSKEPFSSKLGQLVSMENECSGDHYYDLVTAKLYATNKKFKEAINLISRKKDFGDYEESFVMLEAKVYTVTDDQDRAISTLKNYLKKNDKSAKAHLFLGKILNSKRRFDEALDSFIASANIQPTAAAYQSAAVALYALGNCEQAIASIDQAVALDDKTFYDLGSMLVMSRCNAAQGKFVVATNALKMLLQNNPEAEKNPDFKEALSDLRERIRKAKESGDSSTDAHLVELKDV